MPRNNVGFKIFTRSIINKKKQLILKKKVVSIDKIGCICMYTLVNQCCRKFFCLFSIDYLTHLPRKKKNACETRYTKSTQSLLRSGSGDNTHAHTHIRNYWETSHTLVLRVVVSSRSLFTFTSWGKQMIFKKYKINRSVPNEKKKGKEKKRDKKSALAQYFGYARAAKSVCVRIVRFLKLEKILLIRRG